jgi:predicted dienelactone hydrolase
MTGRAAGSRFLQLTDVRTGAPFRVWTLYPTRAASRSVVFGPFTVDVSPDAPVDAGRFPLVVVSHGTGSSPFLFRSLAIRLAAEGYVVAAIEHPGNHRGDDSLADTDENLVNRPRHVRAVLDAVAADADLGPHVAGDRAAVLGHSLGGYTALAVAGGTPWSRTGQLLATESDPRVRALVLFAPAAFWYVPDGALANVTAPILVYCGEDDRSTPPWHAHLILAQVPDKSKVTYHLVEGANHYAFLSALPPSAPAVDPPGFDRDALQERLAAEVRAFLDRLL